MDGRIDAGEWSAATSIEGLQSDNLLVPRRVRVYVGATENTLYVAVRSQVPDKGALLADVHTDDILAVYDDAVEIYVNATPEAKDSVAYQFLFNSLGHGGYDFKCIGKGWERTEWKGNWKLAGSVHDGWWDAEVAIPISSMRTVAPGRKTTDGSWRINVTRDWKNPWLWSALTSGQFSTGGYVFTVDPKAPAVHYADGKLTVYNPTDSDLPLSGEAQLSIKRKSGTDWSPWSTASSTAVVKAGETQTAQVDVPKDQNVTNYQLGIKLTSKDGKTSYYDREVAWTSDGQPNLWNATQEAQKSELLSVSPASNEEFFGAHMQRTMSLLATSNKSRHMPVYIVIYGQSITGSDWWNYLKKALAARFPDADINIENRSVGGLGADILSRLAYHQVYPYYPDLIIFHCYGNEPDYERIFSDIRRYTTSDIMLFTHHYMNVQTGPNDDWEKVGHNISDDRSSDEIRYLAQKYDCELVELRLEWRQYLKQHNLRPVALTVGDGVHMNSHGQELMSYLITRHFRYNPLFPDPWMNKVRLYDARRPVVDFTNDEVNYTGDGWTLDAGGSMVGTSPKSRLRLTFEGNRIDILTGAVSDKNPKLGTARILIDGKAPSSFPDCYAANMPSGAPGTWMPGLLRVHNIKPLVLEDWTLRITKMTEDAKQFSYEVVGSVTGPDGYGDNQHKFVSNSGRVLIEPQDLERITWGHNATEKRAYVGFEVKWKVIPLFRDTFTPQVIKDRSHRYPVTVAQGLANTKHTLEIIPNGDGPVPVDAVQVYCPPMR